MRGAASRRFELEQLAGVQALNGFVEGEVAAGTVVATGAYGGTAGAYRRDETRGESCAGVEKDCVLLDRGIGPLSLSPG